MTTLHKAAQAALEALCLPCDRWNATQYKIVDKAISDLRAALAQEPAQQVVDSDEKAGAYMEARLWEFIDMAAAWPKASPDPRTWNHVMVYAPKPAQQVVTREGLYEATSHGDEKHRTWLKAAIANHFAGLPPPAPDAPQLAVQEPAQQEPVAWKHDCAALLTNNVELWIDRCPHCGKPRTSPQPAVQEPATSFDDPRVQLVYETIIDADDFPPKEDPQQHWDGWIARRIVDKLFAKRLTDEQKRDMVTNYFAEDWAIKAAIGMLDDSKPLCWERSHD